MHNETLNFHNQFLGGVFNLFSLVFAFSFIGLAINLVINYELPITHLFFVAAMLVSVVFGVLANVTDKWISRRHLHYQIKNLFN